MSDKNKRKDFEKGYDQFSDPFFRQKVRRWIRQQRAADDFEKAAQTVRDAAIGDLATGGFKGMAPPVRSIVQDMQVSEDLIDDAQRLSIATTDRTA